MSYCLVWLTAGNNEQLGEFSPTFLWLLRDFYLKLEEDGRQVGKTGAAVDVSIWRN